MRNEQIAEHFASVRERRQTVKLPRPDTLVNRIKNRIAEGEADPKKLANMRDALRRLDRALDGDAQLGRMIAECDRRLG